VDSSRLAAVTESLFQTAGITKGGYGNQAKNGSKKNNHRETIWFSPHCHKAELNLFAKPGK